jgi:hypothetical protein
MTNDQFPMTKHFARNDMSWFFSPLVIDHWSLVINRRFFYRLNILKKTQTT